ncbi:MAG: hypothetical protein ABIQ30_14945 [Devosia sp.]
MKVAVYLHPARVKDMDAGEDYLVTSPEMTAYLDTMNPLGRAVLSPVPELRPLLAAAESPKAIKLRDAINDLEDAHIVMLVRWVCWRNVDQWH